MAPIKPAELAGVRRALYERDGATCHYCGVPVGELSEYDPPWATVGGHCGCGDGRLNPDAEDPDSPVYGSMQVCTGCVYCGPGLRCPDGVKHAQVDHVVPRSKGGGNELGNLVLACFTCNSLKRDLDYAVFLERIGGRRCLG